MRFSTIMTSTCRLIMGGILAMLLVIGMALPVWAMSTTAIRGARVTIIDAPTSVEFQQGSPPPGEKRGVPNHTSRDPGCEGANAHSAICQNNSGSIGNIM